MRPKILIGYDESPEGEDALVLGESLSEVLDANPVVAIVISHSEAIRASTSGSSTRQLSSTPSRAPRRRASASTAAR